MLAQAYKNDYTTVVERNLFPYAFLGQNSDILEILFDQLLSLDAVASAAYPEKMAVKMVAKMRKEYLCGVSRELAGILEDSKAYPSLVFQLIRLFARNVASRKFQRAAEVLLKVQSLSRDAADEVAGRLGEALVGRWMTVQEVVKLLNDL